METETTDVIKTNKNLRKKAKKWIKLWKIKFIKVQVFFYHRYNKIFTNWSSWLLEYYMTKLNTLHLLEQLNFSGPEFVCAQFW